MINLACDYMCGCLPEVMQLLCETNMEAAAGYGFDPYCDEAKAMIRRECNAPDADVFFLVGGTQTNATVIDALLGPADGVLSADSGHIAVHESGAIEAGGHKVLALPHIQGKLSADELEEWLKAFYGDDTNPHMVQPRMLYLTFPTEFGTLYTLAELRRFREICDRYGLYMYIDGARMGYGLAASDDDVTLPNIATIADVFYIGGTKQGLLFGEAVVARKGLLGNFFPVMKQHGAVLAKGRLLGVQFKAAFTDGLYMAVSRRAVALAQRIRKAMTSAGFPTVIDSPTNQQFFRVPNEAIGKLRKIATFDLWGAPGRESSVIRFVTSWATTEKEVEDFCRELKNL